MTHKGSTLRPLTRGGRPGLLGGVVGILLLVSATGCGFDPTPQGNVVDGNCNNPAVKGEPNDSFPEAIEAVFDSSGAACLKGTVALIGDMDVFEIGAIAPGELLTVDADTPTSNLDVAVAIFDEQHRLVFYNDDRGGTSSRALDAHIEWVVRHAGDAYYLVVSHSGFAPQNRFTGSYRVDVRVGGSVEVPPPAGQMLMLDFDGAQVDSPSLGAITLGPFNAADISPIYQGQTDVIKEAIRVTFEQNFKRFDVTVRTTDDPPLPLGTEYSVVYFGGYSTDAFGIAEGVDPYNADFCDDAIIFTESFDPHLFSVDPTAVEMGVAIGNIGSHEAGHLLGLNHVDDDLALMDDASVADAFLDDQEFMQAPVSVDVMPIGTQDAGLLLEETVGPVLREYFEVARTVWGSRP